MRHNIKIIYFYEQQQHIVFYIHQHQTAQCSQKTQTQSVSFISNVENGKWITWMRKALHLFNSQWNRATNNSLGTITANHDPWVCFMMLFVPRSVSTSLNNHLFSLSLLFYTFFFLIFVFYECARFVWQIRYTIKITQKMNRVLRFTSTLSICKIASNYNNNNKKYH